MNSTRSVAVTRALKLTISSAVLALLAITLGTVQPALATATAVTNTTSGESFPSLADALADPDTSDGDTLTLNESLLLDEQVTIDRPITIDGQDHQLTTAFVKTSNANNSAIGILATSGVTISNLVLHGAQSPIDSQLHGFNVFSSTDVTLENVTSRNFRSGVTVNGSSISIDGISTSGNIWHAINIDQPTGTPPASLHISGTNSHDENSPLPASGFADGAHVAHLFVDDINRDVTIVDTAGQYQIDEVAFRGGVARVATLGAQLPAPADLTEKVSGDTAPAYNEVGWLFNRDVATTTPFEFDRDAASIGSGSAHVLPISALNGPDKFIAEYFALESMGTFESFSYDFLIGPGGDAADADHFYMNVYANFGASDPTKFYDCRYNVVPTSGSTADFTTVEFDPTQSYPVAQHGMSPSTCPSQPLAMGGDATLRAFAVNVGDTSTNDGDLDGFIDNVVVETDADVATFDFDPAVNYFPLTPARILDTRDTTSLGAGETRTIDVTDVGGVPDTGVGAVVVNVTAVNGSANTFLTVYPTGATQPITSSMNPRAGQVIGNEIIATVGDDGTVEVFNKNGDIDVILDVVGWIPDTADYEPLTPARILDTRDTTSLGAGETRTIDVTDVGGVPDTGVGAVVVNVTAVNGSANTFLTVYPTGATQPITSSMNPRAGQVVGNEIIATVGDDGTVEVFNKNGDIDVILDVVGWIPDTADYEPLTPARILDTRDTTSLGAGETRTIDVTDVGGVPDTGVGAVVVNVTAVNGSANTFLTVYPTGATQPITSSMNPRAGQVVGNEIIATVGDDGTVEVFNNNGDIDVILDVVGWMPA